MNIEVYNSAKQLTEFAFSPDGQRVARILGAAAVGAAYGLVQVGVGAIRRRQRDAEAKLPPLGQWVSTAVTEGVEWGGAMTLTELWLANQFPEDIRFIAEFATAGMWYQAILPRLYF